MKSPLFVLGLALCCVIQAQPAEEEVTIGAELVSFKGHWFAVVIASTAPYSLEHAKDMSAFEIEVSLPRPDVVSISSRMPVSDGCSPLHTVEFGKGKDGKYYGAPDEKPPSIQSVKVMGDCAIATIKVDDEYTTTVLYSRNETHNPEMLQAFKEECKKLGYTEDQTIILNLPVECRIEE